MSTFMLRRLLIATTVAGMSLGRTGQAQAPTEPAEQPAYQPRVIDAEDLPVRKKSYLYPAAEILTLNISLNLATRAAGFTWADISFDSMRSNLTAGWKIDEDAFTINNAGHPYCGALLFAAARSTGHGFWSSGIYAFAGSAFWEAFMETEVPSTNDQITTPIGGMFIGEVMHRASRALLYPGYGKPGMIRRLGAGLIDPVGELNRKTFGDPWAKTIPPSLYAHFGVGIQAPTTLVGEHGGGSQLHTEVFLEHGLTGDRAFQPRRPLDQFELRASLDSSPDDIDGEFHVRGMLVGKGIWSPRLRGMAGLFGAYDFDNHEYIRASALGAGPGGTAEVQIGRYGYVEATVAGYLVPWGAAGGIGEREKFGRDYHRGPGLSELVEVKAGKRGVGSIRLTTRAFQIAGRLTGEDTNEMVVRSTLGGELHVARFHAIGVEGSYGWRHATSSDDLMERTITDTAAEVRAFYAVTTDEILGR
jgi:hypothetical protein